MTIIFFMIANHIHPMIYAKLALGLINKISDKQIQYTKEIIIIDVPEESNFAKVLNDWKLAYLPLLKAKTLLKDELERTEQVKKFMEWAIFESFTTPASILFILLFFSPRRSKLPTMIKNINSSNFHKLYEGLKNAAWDLTYLAEWRKRCKSQPETTIWFLCSHDKLLQAIARSLYLKQGENDDSALKNLINDYWGKSEGGKVYGYYKEMEKAISSNDDARREHIRNVRPKIDNMIDELELELVKLQIAL